MTPGNSRLSIFSASGAIFSSLVLLFVYYSPALSLLPTLNLRTPTALVRLIPTNNG